MANRKHISAAVRRLVRERANGCCEYCGSQDGITTEPFVIEHIYPHARGGMTLLANLAYACSGCNGRKAAKISAVDVQTGEIVSLFHPRRQRWADHFQWSEEATHVIGVTATGRATVEALGMNRPALVNLRRVLVLAGEHPPT